MEQPAAAFVPEKISEIINQYHRHAMRAKDYSYIGLGTVL